MSREVGRWSNGRRSVRLVEVDEWRVDTRAGDGDAPTTRSRAYGTEVEARSVAERMMRESGDRWRELTPGRDI